MGLCGETADQSTGKSGTADLAYEERARRLGRGGAGEFAGSGSIASPLRNVFGGRWFSRARVSGCCCRGRSETRTGAGTCPYMKTAVRSGTVLVDVGNNVIEAQFG